MLCALWASGVAISPDAAFAKPAPPIVVVILPADKKVDDQLAESIVEMKNAVRNDPRFEVLSYSPDAPSFIIAAKSAGVDLKKLSTDAQRQSLAQALGAKIWVKLGNDRRNETNVDVGIYDALTGQALNGTGSNGVGGLNIQQAINLVISDAVQQPIPSPHSECFTDERSIACYRCRSRYNAAISYSGCNPGRNTTPYAVAERSGCSD